MKLRRLFNVFCLVILFGGMLVAGEEDNPLKVIHSSMLYKSDGTTIPNGTVVVKDGTIVAVGAGLDLPDGAAVFSLGEDMHLTPGLIDAASNAGISTKRSWTEHASEVVPQLKNLDAVDLDLKELDRLAARGVTTIYVTPDPASIIGCQGTVIKTGGPWEKQVVKKTAGIKANMGPEAWRRGASNRSPRGTTTMMTRRPTTRMGMAWVFRKAFHDARVYRRTPGEKKDPAMEMLVRVLDGSVPLRIQAREDIDIWSAIRMCKEYGLSFLLEEGTEAYRCIPELKAYKVPVIYGPIFVTPSGDRARSGELLRPCLNGAGKLVEAGIPIALTAGDLFSEEPLPQQAAYALRFGLPFAEAFKATTSIPAKMLGIGDRAGAVEAGFDADLVLWKGKPFSPASKPVLVLIGGEVVYEDKKVKID